MRGCRFLWISPNWVLNIFLEENRVVCWIFSVVGECIESFFMAYLWWISNSEWTVTGFQVSRNELWWEFLITSIGGSWWIEGSVLTDSVPEWTLLVKNKLCSSLVVEPSHVFLPLICVFNVWDQLLERSRVGRRCAVLEWLKCWSWLLLIELFHVREFRLSYQLSLSTWGEWSCNCLLASALSKEVSARIYVLVTDGIWLKLVECVGSCCSSSCISKLLDFSDVLSCSSILLVVGASISYGKINGDGEETTSLASSLGLNSFGKLSSVFIISRLLSKLRISCVCHFIKMNLWLN